MDFLYYLFNLILQFIYGFIKYTLGTSKFAWHGGKHSDDTITNARARMLDKVKRSPMMIGRGYEEYWVVVPWDNL